MSKEYKVFSVEEANNLVPWLDYQFGMMMRYMSQMESIISNLMKSGVDPSPTMVTVKRSDPKNIKKMKRKMKKLISNIFGYYSKVQDSGVLIQDISTGVVSFYTYFGEHPVFLTWQYGENEVTWWHELYEDSDDRKPLPRNNSVSSVYN